MKKNIKTDTTSKKRTFLMLAFIVVFSLIYVLPTVLTWNDAFWTRNNYIGNIFRPATDSLKYAFSSWTNAICTVISPILLGQILLSVLFQVNNKKHIGGIYGVSIACYTLPTLASIVLYIVMFTSCTPAIAMLYNLCFGLSLLNISSFICVMTLTCEKCHFFNTKELIDKTKSKTRSYDYVPGGYKTVKADVKDKNGNLVGTLETQKYQSGYYTSSSKTEVTRTYKCTVCGNVTESTTES